jgi:hypothetical protein
MLRRAFLVALVSAFVLVGFQHATADVYVNGYFKSNGTYVAPHYRSNADGNFYNNWSTYPNVNPYTGQTGTKLTPSYSPSYRSYYSTPTYTPTYYRGYSSDW